MYLRTHERTHIFAEFYRRSMHIAVPYYITIIIRNKADVKPKLLAPLWGIEFGHVVVSCFVGMFASGSHEAWYRERVGTLVLV